MNTPTLQRRTHKPRVLSYSPALQMLRVPPLPKGLNAPLHYGFVATRTHCPALYVVVRLAVGESFVVEILACGEGCTAVLCDHEVRWYESKSKIEGHNIRTPYLRYTQNNPDASYSPSRLHT